MARLAKGGLIDRETVCDFSFDGDLYRGFRGDTVASALLANGVRLMGRSFKYHRPRGVFSAGPEEPNALLAIGADARKTPNTRATSQELFQGLTAESQNRWPSLRFDLLGVADVLAPLLGAGFYYKTFMWPKAFWERLYEPLIRRAAGLGRLSGEADPDTFDQAYAHCDLLVIGGGPAGLMAALGGARSGARVILADEDFRIGGRLNAERLDVGGMPGAAWAQSALAELHAAANVTVMPRTTVFGAYDGGVYGALERVSEHLAAPPAAMPRQTFWRITARRTILAAGAIERPIALPGNDRPGVMLAGSVRVYLNRYAVAPGARVAVFTNNDDGWRTATDLHDHGIEVAALIDTRRDTAATFDGRIIHGGVVSATRGRKGLKSIEVTSGSATERIAVDTLAISGGWNPTIHLTSHHGAKPVWDQSIAAFVPPAEHVPGLTVAGAAAGAFSTSGALRDGAMSVSAALETKVADIPEAEDGPVSITPFWFVEAPGRAFVDMQNDVTVKDITVAHAENFAAAEHMKRYTTLGMATDQGKTGNVIGLGIMSELSGRTVSETGVTTFRPPYTPVAIAALAGRNTGSAYRPKRMTPAHEFAKERNAPMLEAGLWMRAAWFPRAGETHWRQSCDREAQTVRERVGVCDVTTLGKIELLGPDVGTFLDLVYSNVFSTLAPGRVRYGLMLREDGFVFDDGTTARLNQDRWLMTTTTAHAVDVMRHLEFCHQGLRPDLDVQFASVTEQWAQFAVAGPQARALLEPLVSQDLSDAAFPFMACASADICGVAGRVFRISFSGELGYEVAVPARYGNALMSLLVEKAEARGGCVYGMEALNVLRIEKGHVTGAELHGRTTADDCGFGRMVSAKKDCIGKWGSQRPGLKESGREQLVGLKPATSAKRLLGGAHFLRPGDAATPENDQGYMVSVCYSPALETMIGLGFVKDGRSRMGEVLRAVDLLRDYDTAVEIVSPHFVDPDGGRMRG